MKPILSQNFAGPGAKYDRLLVLLFLGTLAVRLLCIFNIPITLDEAYYSTWSSNLEWGYLDHPPAVALLGIMGRFFNSAFAVRFLACFVATVGAWYIVKITRLVAPDKPSAAFIAFALVHCSIGGFATGILLNPDVVMTTAWTIAIHEFLLVLRGQKRRWISTGAACGIGFLSKYIAVLLPLCILIFLTLRLRSELKNVWFRWGVLTCITICMPHLVWNQQHDWVTFGFLLNRGFKGKHGSSNVARNELPELTSAQPGSAEDQINQFFSATGPSRPPAKKVTRLALPKPVQSFLDFLGGQFGLWGLFSLPLLAFLFRDMRQRWRNESSDPLLLFLIFVTFWPLIFFGIISFGSKVEANWAGAHIIGGGILVGVLTTVRTKWYSAIAVVHLMLFGLVGISSESFAKVTGFYRIRDEVSGYEELAMRLADKQAPIFADTYQTVSMLKFYGSTFEIYQWPGISRVSEYNRHPIPKPVIEKLQVTNFTLIVNGLGVRHIEGFSPKDAFVFMICDSGENFEISFGDADASKSMCKKVIKRWLVVDYQAL